MKPEQQQAILDTGDGDALIIWSWRLTAVLAVSLVAGLLAPSKLLIVAVSVSLVFFAGGIVAFAVAYAMAVGRSRTEEVSVAGLFLMSEGAPTRVRRHLLASLGAQVLVAVAAGLIRPFTPIAFGILAPMLGLGLIGLWSARYGVFGLRLPSPQMGSTRPADTRTQSSGRASARLSEDSLGDTDA